MSDTPVNGIAPSSAVEVEEGVFESVAVIDNGRFGTRTVRFETGRLAKQAAGTVVAYLDEDTMLLSATTAGKHPREGFDFFPLTVDVEERMYATTEPAACLASRPVSNRMVRLPKLPLSMTASVS